MVVSSYILVWDAMSMHILLDLDSRPRYVNSHFFAFICMDWIGVSLEYLWKDRWDRSRL